MHFNFKHVCTHSFGEFVQTHLGGLVELVHTRSVDYVTRTTRNRAVYLILPYPFVNTCSLYYVILLIKYFPYMRVNLVNAVWKFCVNIGQVC